MDESRCDSFHGDLVTVQEKPPSISSRSLSAVLIADRLLRLTFVHASVFVLNHCQLIDLAKLLKDRLEVLFFQIPRNLPHKQLDGIGLLHQDGVERTTEQSGF